MSLISLFLKKVVYLAVCANSFPGIDTVNQHARSSHRKAPRSENPYLKLLVKLYRFLARRTDANFNKVVLKRLYMSATNRPAMSISRLAKNISPHKDKTAVVVASVTDDNRLLTVPKMSVAALRFTATAVRAPYL